MIEKHQPYPSVSFSPAIGRAQWVLDSSALYFVIRSMCRINDGLLEFSASFPDEGDRYASWITRDWDPVRNAKRIPGGRDEDSPEAPVHYRRVYAAAFENLQLLTSGYSPHEIIALRRIAHQPSAMSDVMGHVGVHRATNRAADRAAPQLFTI